jgi:serine/threonine-protein kinase
MGTPLPPQEVKFAQLAVKQQYVSQDHVRSSLELYRRYQAASGEVPSIPRLLVQKGYLARDRAEVLLRHLLKGEPLPAPGTPASGTSVPAPASGEPPAEGPAFEGSASASTGGGDEQAALLQGLGATVLRGEIKGYKILQVVGEGSMGTVYRAHQLSMDRIVALKVLTHTKNQAFVEQFLTEARNAGRLNHPNLIRVHEVGRSGTLYYYSMEYVDGLTLGELMDEFEGGRLDPKRAANIFLQIATALDHGYRMNIIHREIRPKSIMITEGDQAKLDSLGLTKDEVTRFLSGENAHYVSPEQAKGLSADTRSDLYSLGCCMYHALTGEPPFTGGGPKEILGRRLITDVPDPRQANPSIPPDLAAVCMMMMARDVKTRYQTPAELMDALKKVSFGPVPGAARPGTKGRLPAGADGRAARGRMAARRHRHRFRR